MYLLLFRLGWRVLLVLTSTWIWPGSALADTPSAQPDLYLEAMQALSEGRTDDAQAMLSRMLAQAPQHAGAWIDLAVLQCSLGHAGEADKLLAEIEARFAPPAEILALIAELRARGCRGGGRQAPVSARVRAGRGVDSNANQGASNLNFSIGSGSQQLDLMLTPEYAPRGDQFSFIEADFNKVLPTGGTGFVQLQVRKNDTESANNLVSASFGGDYVWRAGGWDWRGMASAGVLYLGGALYQRQQQLQLLASRPVALVKETSLSMLADWSHMRYPTLRQFDANVWQLRGLLSHRSGGLRLQAVGGYAYDAQLAQRPGGDRKGWAGSVSADVQLWHEAFAGLSWSRQNWRGQTGYAPGVVDRVRAQRLDVLRANLTWPVASGQSVQLEWRVVRNDENISIFQYASRVVQVSWQWQLGP